MPKYARVTGWGKYVPGRVVANSELEKLVNTSENWVYHRTGIKERRIASKEETATTMAVEAGAEALKVAGLPAASLDLVIAATVTPEMIFPACASLVQHHLGAKKAAAFDLNAACSGFVYALATACQFIAAGSYQNILVVGTEVYSRIVNWKDRRTCVLFGDGAGAVVVQAKDSLPGALGFTLGSDGSGADMIYVPGPARYSSANGFNGDGSSNDNGNGSGNGSANGIYLSMKGREVFKFAVTAMCRATRQVVAASGLEMSDIDLLIPHQSNKRIIQAAARTLKLPTEKVFCNIERYANTSAASIPIALCEAVEQGRLKEGDHLVLVGFGGGLSWGAMAMQWGQTPS